MSCFKRVIRQTDYFINKQIVQKNIHSFCSNKLLNQILFPSEQMGRIQCPVLSVLGDDDPTLPSNESAVDVSLDCC